jgi:hypothetical protein
MNRDHRRCLTRRPEYREMVCFIDSSFHFDRLMTLAFSGSSASALAEMGSAIRVARATSLAAIFREVQIVAAEVRAKPNCAAAVSFRNSVVVETFLDGLPIGFSPGIVGAVIVA